MKYSLLIAGINCISIPIISYFTPFMIENDPPDIVTAVIYLLIGVFFILIFLIVKDMFVLVKMGSQNISFIYNKQEKNISWLDIEKITKIPFVTPSLYKLKTKNKETILFNSGHKYIDIIGFNVDISDMRSLIEKKKKELGI